jgi:hypothetical protein
MKLWLLTAFALVLVGCASVSSRALVKSKGDSFRFTIEKKQTGISLGHSLSPILPQKWTVGEIVVSGKKTEYRDRELTVSVPELYDRKRSIVVPATGTLAVDWSRRQVVVDIHVEARDGLPAERMNGTFAF